MYHGIALKNHFQMIPILYITKKGNSKREYPGIPNEIAYEIGRQDNEIVTPCHKPFAQNTCFAHV
jgi:hypothetical protein